MTEEPTSGQSSTPAGADGESSADARPRSARFWVVSAVVAFLVLVAAVPVALTATPRQCATCHEMKPYYDSWQSSTHRAAAPNCLYCHARPGVLGVLGFEAGFYGMVAGHLSGARVETTGANAPVVASCSRSDCHSLNRETSNSGDIKINHRLHVAQARIPCTQCHPGAVHAGVGGRLKLPPMKLCKVCHADKMQQCTYCHVEEHLTAAPGTH